MKEWPDDEDAILRVEFGDLTLDASYGYGRFECLLSSTRRVPRLFSTCFLFWVLLGHWGLCRSGRLRNFMASSKLPPKFKLLLVHGFYIEAKSSVI